MKRRTTIMLPVDLLAELDKLRGTLGVSRSALLAMAGAAFVAHAASIIVPKKRADSLDAVEEMFTTLMKKARGDG